MTLANNTVNALLARFPVAGSLPGLVALDDETSLPISPTISMLSLTQNTQRMALIQDIGLIIIWDDSPKRLLVRAQHLEQQLAELLWDSDTPGESD